MENEQQDTTPWFNELSETHNYVRHTSQMLLTWYTFFITANLAAVGWSITQADGGTDSDSSFWAILSGGLVFVNLLAIAAILYLQRQLAETDRRVQQVIRHISGLLELDPAAKIHLRSPIPAKLYGAVLKLMMISLCGVSIGWAYSLAVNL